MKTFSMSMYITPTELYKEKAKYYEQLFKLCANKLVSEGILVEQDGEYICVEDCITLDDHLKYGDSL